MNFYSPILFKPASTCSPMTNKRGALERPQLKKEHGNFISAKCNKFTLYVYIFY